MEEPLAPISPQNSSVQRGMDSSLTPTSSRTYKRDTEQQSAIPETAGSKFKFLVDALFERELTETEAQSVIEFIREALQRIAQTPVRDIKECVLRDFLEVTKLREKLGFNIINEVAEVLLRKAKEPGSDQFIEGLLALFCSFDSTCFSQLYIQLEELVSHLIQRRIADREEETCSAVALPLTIAFCTIAVLAANTRDQDFFRRQDGVFQKLKGECEASESALVSDRDRILPRTILAYLDEIEKKMLSGGICDTKTMCKNLVLCYMVLEGDESSASKYLLREDPHPGQRPSLWRLRRKGSERNSFARLADLIAEAVVASITPKEFGRRLKRIVGWWKTNRNDDIRRSSRIVKVLLAKYMLYTCRDDEMRRAWMNKLVKIGKKLIKNKDLAKHVDAVEVMVNFLSTIISEYEEAHQGCSVSGLSLENALKRIVELYSDTELRELFPRAPQECESSRILEEVKSAFRIPDFEEELARHQDQLLSKNHSAAPFIACSNQEFMDRKIEFLTEPKTVTTLKQVFSARTDIGRALVLSGDASMIERIFAEMLLRCHRHNLPLNGVSTILILKPENLAEQISPTSSLRSIRNLPTVIATACFRPLVRDRDFEYAREWVREKLKESSTLVVFDLMGAEAKASGNELIRESSTSENFNHKTVVLGRPDVLDHLPKRHLARVQVGLLEDEEVIECLDRRLNGNARRICDRAIAKDKKTAVLQHPVLLNAFCQFCREAAARNRINNLPNLGNILAALMSEVWLRSLEESGGIEIDREELFRDLNHLASQFNHPEDDSIRHRLPDLYLCYDKNLEIATAVGVVVNENGNFRFLEECFLHAFQAFSIIEIPFEETARPVLEAAGLE